MIRSGIDLVRIERIAQAIERNGQKFLDRIFTPAEQAICAGAAHRLAGRFAVKEAVSKALHTGIGDVSWVEIEVLQGAHGEPRLHLHGNAQRVANEVGVSSWSVSISHTDTDAVGLAVGLISLQMPPA